VKRNLNQWWNRVPSKGGLIGAILGALLSFRFHQDDDTTVKNAGKTALLSGAGFLAGNWIEKMVRKK